MSKCPQCSKTYNTKSGLRRHVKAQHPAPETSTPKAAPHEEPVTDDQDAHDQDVLLRTMDGPAMLKTALKALAIKPADVMSYRVYPDKVVIIEGPVGWKRVWRPEEK